MCISFLYGSKHTIPQFWIVSHMRLKFWDFKFLLIRNTSIVQLQVWMNNNFYFNDYFKNTDYGIELTAYNVWCVASKNKKICIYIPGIRILSCITIFGCCAYVLTSPLVNYTLLSSYTLITLRTLFFTSSVTVWISLLSLFNGRCEVKIIISSNKLFASLKRNVEKCIFPCRSWAWLWMEVLYS